MSNHSHMPTEPKTTRKLFLAFSITITVFIAEVVGGLMTGSLALLSDAAHMFSDLAALTVSLMAIKIGQRPADSQRTFGYRRFEILAAAFNTLLLFFVALYIIYEAYQRLYKPTYIYSLEMFAIASVGLIANFVSVRVLSDTNQQNSLNLKSAYLEVWSDMLASIGVMFGAVIIYFTGITWVDSVIAVLIGLWVLPRTWIILKASINILLEGVPENIDMEKLRESVLSINGIISMHDLHVWSITNDKISLTAHIVIEPSAKGTVILLKLREMLSSKYGISHTTLELETEECLIKKTQKG